MPKFERWFYFQSFIVNPNLHHKTLLMFDSYHQIILSIFEFLLIFLANIFLS